MMEDKAGLCDSDVVHRSKSQIILFNAHVNKANGARKICKLPSNWPVRMVKRCQTTVRGGGVWGGARAGEHGELLD